MVGLGALSVFLFFVTVWILISIGWIAIRHSGPAQSQSQSQDGQVQDQTPFIRRLRSANTDKNQHRTWEDRALSFANQAFWFILGTLATLYREEIKAFVDGLIS